ncbi:MAG: right-handed parallel beta-helix repeat-containing protein [Bacteroidales bacterium]|jgi:hypothetical protein|nr:right-handed parallel beta-helix repeat-containing protein [Bacteroidales bacterium]NLM92239.1 hypothetical protein [Bacteroidales bacterium]
MRSIRFFVLLLFLPLLTSLLFSCREDGYDADPSIELGFSADSLLFDTVFTTVGTATRSFRVYNHHSKRVRIASIALGSGTDSYFRVNVDGRSGSSIQDVEIGANDSIFVFVEVTVDPVNQNTPLVIVDSLLFRLNGNEQDVKLVAWGQDAHFFYPNYTEPASGLSYHLISDDTTWGADLPYVIYGLAVVAPNKTLTLEAGTRVHLHNNASLVFLGGASLKVYGMSDAPVLFQGDRLEPFYDEQPGQWGRIWLTATSKDHLINHAIIKNGSVGLHVDSIGSYSSPTLTIKNTIIKNMSMVGILAQGSNVVAENTVVANCGQQTLYLALGGKYDFRHCTFANYFNLPNTSLRQTPSVFLNNYYVDVDGVLRQRDFESVFFGNSIVYGSIQEELQFDLAPGSDLNFLFDHCLVRTQRDTFNPAYSNVIKNQSPQFNDLSLQDYRLRDNSPAINAGKPEIASQIPLDILGRDRTLRPDIGAYQYYEIEEEQE